MPKIKLKANGEYVDHPDNITSWSLDNDSYTVLSWNDDMYRPHREGKPAYIQYDPDTLSIISETWCRHGREHREDGPSMTCYSSSGSIDRQYWRVNGKKHRLNGPAVIHYREDGSIIRSYMYINGKWTTKNQLAKILGLPNQRHITYPLSKADQTTLKLIYQ